VPAKRSAFGPPTRHRGPERIEGSIHLGSACSEIGFVARVGLYWHGNSFPGVKMAGVPSGPRQARPQTPRPKRLRRDGARAGTPAALQAAATKRVEAMRRSRGFGVAFSRGKIEGDNSAPLDLFPSATAGCFAGRLRSPHPPADPQAIPRKYRACQKEKPEKDTR
jgi:hypothetical protein